jgi:hypothetical protein
MTKSFTLRSILIAVAMAAVAMMSVRMSVPEDRTCTGLIPLIGFALIGVWAAGLWGRSVIAGGVAGGIVGAISNVATQYVYYRVLHDDPFANVNDLGIETCLTIDSIAGSIVGVLIGSIVWVSLRLRARPRRG